MKLILKVMHFPLEFLSSANFTNVFICPNSNSESKSLLSYCQIKIIYINRVHKTWFFESVRIAIDLISMYMTSHIGLIK